MLISNIENAVLRQVGGAKGGNGKGSDMLMVLLVGLLFLCVKSYLVMVTYNSVAPRVITNNGGDLESYRDITFGESVMLVILINNLFC